MPPFQRRRYYYRNWWNSWNRRNRFRRRRFGKTFQTRRRRRRRVRRKRFKRHKKLKKLKIQQWQPTSIKRCRIEGYLSLFEAGIGRYSYNYALWKESIFPHKYAGGGGWSIQQLNLGNLFTQHKEYMNYWTRSNVRMNLCRYLGCKITLFRQPFTDYVFTYFEDIPKTVSKYFYCSYHPLRLLTHKRKKIVPSNQTQPHKRKPYKSIFIPPPKLFKNQWFFQQPFSDYSLLTFAVTACSLTNMQGSNSAANNNTELYILDTSVFTHPNFQYKTQTHPQYGYQVSSNKYLWGLPNGHDKFTDNKISDCVYLGNTMLNQQGDRIGTQLINQTTMQNYPYAEWGNPFHWTYLEGKSRTLITTEDPLTLGKTATTRKLKDTEERTHPYYSTVRYNPYKDKGIGNRLYFLPTYDHSQSNWNATNDPDILFENYPLWLMCWGLQDIIKRMGKCRNIDEDWVCVIQSNYFDRNEPYYVPLSFDFVHGRGPYDTDPEDFQRDDYTNWYPRWKYQKQAIENIIMTGPAVARGDNVKNIQATMKYNFFFKWGGTSSPQETVNDPTQQPVTPSPNNFNIINEITNPQTSITSEIYPWDFRRDFLTKSATERIKQSPTDELLMLTDGKQTSTDLDLWKTETQEKTTQEKETQTLLQQLQQLQQYNQLLNQRLRNLEQLSMDQ
nr:MAG: ORF1 [TTV-like mini virus]